MILQLFTARIIRWGCFPFGGEAPCGDESYWSLNPGVYGSILPLSPQAYINKKLRIY